MALRGKKPEDLKKRLKLMIFGPAGVGKTTAGIQMPQPYIIDCERGTDHYADIINDCGGAVFHATQLKDVVTEVRSLHSQKHDFRSVVIDPITLVYQDLVEEGEKLHGTEWGRHYGYANTGMKRLFNLLMALDMNVVITAHSKAVYGDKMKVVGQTYDAWKRLPYMFDLVVELYKHEKIRMARVEKTRMTKQFPEDTHFPWSYNAVAERCGAEILEKRAEVIDLGTPAQVKEFSLLLDQLNDQEKARLKIDKALKGVENLADLPLDRLLAGTKLMSEYLAEGAAA